MGGALKHAPASLLWDARRRPLVVPLAVVKREEKVASTCTLSQFFCLKASTPGGGSTERRWDHIAKAFTLYGRVVLAIEEGKILEIRKEEPAADAREEEVAWQTPNTEPPPTPRVNRE